MTNPGVVHRPDTDRHHRRAVERVIVSMHERLDQELSLEEMAAVAFMSPFYLNRVFHQVTGVPPGRFLTALRLAAAKRLLVTSSLSVTEVSLEVGYNSLGTFTRRFTELVGMGPSRFRALSRAAAGRGFDALGRLAEPGRPAGGSGPARGVTGRVEAPRGFTGPIFVGLFDSAVPQSRPLACAVLAQPGMFQLSGAPDGAYHLVSMALPFSPEPRDLLLYDTALRAGTRGQAVQVRGGASRGLALLPLRPAEPTDPPILLTLPLLMSERLAPPAGLAGEAPAERARG